MPDENIRNLSRSTNVKADYINTKTSHQYAKLYEAVSAGCLQRIADSLERMERPYSDIKRENLKLQAEAVVLKQQISLREDESIYKLKKQVAKLSARLRKAGLDGDPLTDQRKFSYKVRNAKTD